MRVALLSANAQAGDALGNQLAEKLAFFLERGADVTVVVESDRCLHPAIASHCRVLPRPEPLGPAWESLHAADLVIADFSQSYALLELLPLLAEARRRILLDYHGVTPPELWSGHNREGLTKGLQQRGLVWCADAAAVHSTFARCELLEPTGYPPEQTFALGYPIDNDHFCPGPPRAALRTQLGLHAESLLLFVGRLAPNKRLPVLVEALGRLRDRRPAVHAIVIGDQSDLYRAEADRCRQRAIELGVDDRLHLLGSVSDEQLRDAYRSADIFVMPSRHEGFCLPVVEAMACGLPVIAARAAALPETVGDGGLTFVPDDADDLARQIDRVLDGRWRMADGRWKDQSAILRVAVVACRYGTDFVGGAETSLRTIAEALHHAGHPVEVFTTCATTEDDWSDQRAAGTEEVGGIAVHRFPITPHDQESHLASLTAIVHASGPVPAETERDYLAHSLHSARLLEALRARIDEFDAVIVGPYLFGLTHDVAREFPERTLLLPCFHDEPFARLALLRATYERVGGILYHSPEEQKFAEVQLGLNHPGAVQVRTALDLKAGDASRGREQVGSGRRYLVYCGRYSPEKNLPLLLEYARSYHAEHADRFTFVFVGQGPLTIPREPWARDLGFVEKDTVRDVLAGAEALVQLSRAESLSLVALEAWAQGVPVLADARCAVLVGQLERSGGGRAVDSYASFARALDELWEHPERWQAMGQRGRAYVHENHGARDEFVNTLVGAVRDLTLPLGERMRRKGLARAARYSRAAWREQFGQLIDEVLHAPARPFREQLEVRPRGNSRAVSPRSPTVLVPVQVENRGTHAVVGEGPARRVLRCQVFDETGRPHGPSSGGTPLPGLLLPGRSLAAVVPVPVPAVPGHYTVALWAEAAEDGDRGEHAPRAARHPQSKLSLLVEAQGPAATAGCCGPLLEAAQNALAHADRMKRLPADYTDVTEGWFAAGKRWLKRKLLGNFKRAYVDVLSRQQSAFNQDVVTALGELAECCATLDHARRLDNGAESVEALRSALGELRGQLAALQQRLARLERDKSDASV
jgi:glycosyltransferase involved in cell wall biosynthesis